VKALRRIRMPQTQRNRELGLLLFAFLINAPPSRSCSSARPRTSTGRSCTTAAASPCWSSACTSCCATAPQADPFVVPIATVLSGLGLAMIYRIDIEEARPAGRPLDPPARVARIAIAAAVAIVVF
jgi:hypothetical protein